jgi:hypothetical protein
MHQCYLCSPENHERIVTGTIVEFGERFTGPPARVHGGIAVGALTCPALQFAEQRGLDHPIVKYVSGRLRTPVPLASPLQTRVSGNGEFGVELFDNDTLTVSGTVAVVDLPMTPGAVIQEASEELATELESMSDVADANLDGPSLLTQYANYCALAGVDNKNNCFGCSEKSPALKLHCRATDQGDVWTRWATETQHIDEPGCLATAIVTAALDCSNLWVLQVREEELSLRMRMFEGKAWITGTHAVHFLRVPDIGGDYRVVTRFLRREGRKAFTAAALFDREGTAYAVAEAISILIDLPPEMVPQHSTSLT